MIERLRFDWLAWLLLIGGLVSLLGPLALLSEVGQPYGGYITFQRVGTPYNEVDGNTPVWWSGMTFGRLVHGDQIRTVNDIPHREARRAYAEAAATVSSAILEVERAGQTLSLTLPVRPFTVGNFFDVRLPDLITSLVLWLAAVIVYFARPDDPANRAFAIASAIAGYGRLLYVHTLFFDTPLALVNELLLQTWLAFLGAGVLLLALRYPTVTNNRAAGALFAVFVGLSFVSLGATLLSRSGLGSPALRATAQEVGYLLSIALVLGALLAVLLRLIAWLISARHSRRDRRIAGVLLVGWALALPPIMAGAYTAIAPPGQGSYYFLYGLDLRYMLLFAPLGFAFVLVRYQAMQAPSPMFIFLMVLATSAVVAALSAWLWILTHQRGAESSLQPPFFSLFIAGLIIGLFWTLIAVLPKVLGRTLAWDRYSSTTAREFGRRVSDGLDLNRTPETIVQAMVDEFELEQCALWVAEDDGAILRLAAQAGNSPAALPEHILLAGRHLPSRVHPFRPSEIDSPEQPWAHGSAEAQRIEVVVPLVMNESLLGALAVGRRWDEDVFDTRNLELLEIVGQQVTWLLAVSQQIQELQRVPARLADAQERERQRIAHELHDTTQQFLGRLPFYLAVSRDTMTKNPQTAAELLNRSIDDVEEAAQVVRQIRQNLAPSQLERGLAQALVTLTTGFQRRTGIETSLIYPPDLDDATPPETRHALYRVVQQALTNVETHAHADEVTVELTVENGIISLTVRDNGRGCSEEERRAARSMGSFGIESMTARLVGVGGGLTLASAPREGLELNGWVPAVASPNGDSA